VEVAGDGDRASFVGGVDEPVEAFGGVAVMGTSRMSSTRSERSTGSRGLHVPCQRFTAALTNDSA
jgi:hypothetical protein